MTVFNLPKRARPGQDPASCIDQGEACSRRGDFTGAVAWFDRALDLDPKSAKAYTGKGLALQNLSRDKEALACFSAAFGIGCSREQEETAPKVKGGKPPVHGGGGNLEAGAGKAGPAPDTTLDAEAWYGKALHYGAISDFERAVECFDQALQLCPTLADAWINRGRALGKLGRYKGALASFDRALALRPDDAEALYYKGTTLVFLNRLPDAYSTFERALAISPGNRKAETALADLRLIMEQVKGKKSAGDGTAVRDRRRRIL